MNDHYFTLWNSYEPIFISLYNVTFGYKKRNQKKIRKMRRQGLKV